MSTKPVYANNAIDLIAFGVVLSKAFNTSIFTPEELAKVRALIGQEFVDGALLEEFEVNEQSDFEGAQQSSKIVGFEFRTAHDDELDSWIWGVKVVDDTVAIVCKRFSTWAETWKKVESLFQAIFEAFSISTFDVVETGLQLIDQFDLDDLSLYNKSDVFDVASDYFSKKTLMSESSWHLHQGWFEMIPSPQAFILHNLNFNASVADNVHVTRISHVMKVRPVESSSLYSNIKDAFSTSSGLPFLMAHLYELNKKTMREILSDAMKKQTGLVDNE